MNFEQANMQYEKNNTTLKNCTRMIEVTEGNPSASKKALHLSQSSCCKVLMRICSVLPMSHPLSISIFTENKVRGKIALVGTYAALPLLSECHWYDCVSHERLWRILQCLSANLVAAEGQADLPGQKCDTL